MTYWECTVDEMREARNTRRILVGEIFGKVPLEIPEVTV
jgi:hypothetical protein